MGAVRGGRGGRVGTVEREGAEDERVSAFDEAGLNSDATGISADWEISRGEAGGLDLLILPIALRILFLVAFSGVPGPGLSLPLSTLLSLCLGDRK